MEFTTTVLLFAVALAAQDRFEDPSPPKVRELEQVTPPKAEEYPELRYHTKPKPLAADAITQDWPTFLGPDRTGRSKETRLLKRWPEEGPELVWEMKRGQGYASPVIADGRLVFTHRVGNELHVDCLEAETGRRYWRFTVPTEYRDRYISNVGPRSTPAISDGRVYVHGLEGTLHCLELATGRVVWERNLHEELGTDNDYFGVVSSPLVVGDLLVQNVGAPGGPSVAAFDKHTGRIVWGSGEEWGPSCASPVLASVGGRSRLFVLAGGDSRPPTGGLLVMDPESGALDFQYPFRSNTYESVNASCPVVEGDRVFITASYGVGSATLELQEEGFTELWRNRHVAVQFSNPIFHEGHVYVIDGVSGRTGAVVCIDPSNGEELVRLDLHWQETILDAGEEKTINATVGEGSLLRADGDFLSLGDLGHLMWLRLSPERGEVLASASLFRASESWTPLVVSNGLLYVCQNNKERFGEAPARLLCYDLRAGG